MSAVGALVAPGVGSLTFETTVSHGGSVAGYTASMAVDPETRIGVVLLRNYQSGATNLGRAAQGLVARLSALTR
jgi:CubicO group peptidase (beta-lactamase class C family)